jgi:splicing factor 3A subunit 3
MTVMIKDEDDAPVYNPKNIPLDWDEPMPYWLYVQAAIGLQHYYDCQICGGETQRPTHELHFADQKSQIGMKSLGIPQHQAFV